MASIARIGGQTFVAHLTWRAIAHGPDLEKKVAAALKDERASWGVIHDPIPTAGNEQTRVLGLIPDSEIEADHKGQIPLALAVGERIKDGFVVAPLDGIGEGARWWKCGFADGAVIPGTDLVARKDLVIEELRNDLDVSSHAQIHATAQGAEALLQLGRDINEIDLEQIVRQSRFSGRVAKLKKQTGAAVAAVAFMLVALAGAGWFVWSMLEEPEYETQALTDEELRRQAIEAWTAARGLQVDRILPADGTSWARAAKATVFDLQRIVRGYELEKASCKPNGYCEVIYRAASRPSLTEFDAVMAGRAHEPIVYSIDGNIATMKLWHDGGVATDIRGRTLAFYDAVPDHRRFVRELVTRTMRLKNAVEAGWSTTLNDPRPVGLEGIDPFSVTYYEGTLSFSMQELWMFDAVMDLLESKYVSVTSMEILSRPAPSIKVDASYVVAKYPKT